MSLHSLILKIRHHKLIKNSDWLWNLIRKPYSFLIDPFNKGIVLKINDDTSIRLPLKYYSKSVAEYEKEPTKYLTSWIKSNPDALIIDIGASLGFISSIALHSSNNCKVIGIDSDIMSLKISTWICSYAKGNRYSTIECYVTNNSDKRLNYIQAINNTSKKLELVQLKNAVNSNQYKSIEISNFDSNIPSYTIDDLFLNEVFKSPIIIKCDIEGAEVLAIKGAESFIKKHKPILALSVHPDLVKNYHSTSEEFRDLILSLGYSVELISIDHEEHWWCKPNNK